MRAEVASLQEAFEEPAAFEAPYFQRPYRWRRQANWEPFWEHWRRSAAEARPNFLGAIVLGAPSSPNGAPQVLDGQQRLLTSLVALRALLEDADAPVDAHRPAPSSEEREMAAGIRSLIWRANGASRIRPARGSARDLAAALADGPIEEELGGLCGARRFFEDRIAAERVIGGTSWRDLTDALLKRTSMVLISTGEDVSAFDTFERLNNLGEPLSVLDLVKTQLFAQAAEEGRSRDALERLYDAHWIAFDDPDRVGFWGESERRGSETRLRQDWFLRAYLSVRLRRAASAAETQARMRDLAVDGAAAWAPGVVEQGAVQEIASLGRAAAAFLEISGAAPSDRASARIETLRRFARKTVEPALIAVRMHLWDDEVASDAALSVLESCAVRRFVVGLASSRDYDAYARFSREITAADPEAAADAPRRLAQRMIAAGDGRFWPDNAALRTAMLENGAFEGGGGPAGDERRRQLKAFLMALDAQAAGLRPEPDAAWEQLTLIRLAPLSDPGLIEDQPAANLLGNVTLATDETAAEVEGRPWPRRRDILARAGALHLNQRLAYDARYRIRFGPEEIRARGEKLVGLALARWPRPR